VVGLEDSDFEETSKKHDEGHLVTGAIIDSGRVAETVGQVDADLVDAGVVSGFQNFLQLGFAFLKKLLQQFQTSKFIFNFVYFSLPK
jgi:hypothetical protein